MSRGVKPCSGRGSPAEATEDRPDAQEDAAALGAGSPPRGTATPGCVPTWHSEPRWAPGCMVLEASPAPGETFISINLEMKKLRLQPVFYDLPKVTRGGSGQGVNEPESVQPQSLCSSLSAQCLQRGRRLLQGPGGGHDGAAVGQAGGSPRWDRGRGRAWEGRTSRERPPGQRAT